jgi:serine/threonine-protein kinase
LKDYDTASKYLEQAERVLPHSSRVLQGLAYVERRRGDWVKSEAYFNEAEKLDPLNVNLLSQHARSYVCQRRFPEALAKLEQILNITPDDIDTLVLKARIAQAEGDLSRASTLLAPLRLGIGYVNALETQVYQAILESRPTPVIAQLQEILAKPDESLGFYVGELRFWLGWAQEVAGDREAALKSWGQARTELESFLKEQPDNFVLMGDLALTNMGLGDNTAALGLAERAVAQFPIDKDALTGPRPLEILARVAARIGDPERSITMLEKLLSIPYEAPLAANPPLTPALLRLDPMFEPLRNDPRFQKLIASSMPK